MRCVRLVNGFPTSARTMSPKEYRGMLASGDLIRTTDPVVAEQGETEYAVLLASGGRENVSFAVVVETTVANVAEAEQAARAST